MAVPRHWRTRTQRYALMGEECSHCKSKLFPPRQVCPECGSPVHLSFVLPGRTEAYSFSPIDLALARHQEWAPHTLALVAR
jgi:uncharacterized OB-fold protein